MIFYFVFLPTLYLYIFYFLILIGPKAHRPTGSSEQANLAKAQASIIAPIVIYSGASQFTVFSISLHLLSSISAITPPCCAEHHRRGWPCVPVLATGEEVEPGRAPSLGLVASPIWLAAVAGESAHRLPGQGYVGSGRVA